MGESTSRQSTQATQQSQRSQATQESTATNTSSGRGRGNITRFGRGAFSNAPPATNTGRSSGRGRGNNTRFGRGASPNTPPTTAPKNLLLGLKEQGGEVLNLHHHLMDTTGMTVINPGSSGERVVSFGTKVVKDTSAVNIDIGFKPLGLNFKGRNAITTSQLQQLSANRRNQIGSSSTTSSVASPTPPAP
nr:uncharacterized protein LOC108944094 [Nicotiana tomentosiformis]